MNDNVLKNGKTEIWTDEYNWTKKVLEPMGEASFEEIKQAMAENKKLTYRYIVENHYTESIKDAGSKISYSQIFIEGENAGYFEEHPHREYKKLEDGRTIAIGEPTIAYDLLFEYKNIRRVGSVYVWIGESRGNLTIKTITHKPILEDGEPWESEIEVNNRLLSAIEEIKKANPKETHIAVNPHRKEGEPYAIAYINGEIDKAVELYCYTIGETEYLEQNVPNITFNEKTN